jgi:hypothetical protein
MPLESNRRIVVLEPDLLFSSKIQSAAEKKGFAVTVVTSFDELRRELEKTRPSLLALSLDSLGTRLGEIQTFIRLKAGECVGYYSHLNTRLADEARRLSIGTVVSRGAFFSKLEDILDQSSGSPQSF